MKNEKLIDCFLKTILAEVIGVEIEAYTDRNLNLVNTDMLFPIGTIMSCKHNDYHFMIIDRDDKNYLLASLNGINSRLVSDKDGFIGYTFKAANFNILDFNKLFGADKETGITPTNSFGYLSNVKVSKTEEGLIYKLTPIVKVVATNINPIIVKLISTIFNCFVSSNYCEMLESECNLNSFAEKEPTYCRIDYLDKEKDQRTTEYLNMVEAMQFFPMELEHTGKFISKDLTKVEYDEH